MFTSAQILSTQKSSKKIIKKLEYYKRYQSHPLAPNLVETWPGGSDMLAIFSALCLINSGLCSRLDTSWKDIRTKDTREMVLGMYHMCLMGRRCVAAFLISRYFLVAISLKPVKRCIHCMECILFCSLFCFSLSPCLCSPFLFSNLFYLVIGINPNLKTAYFEE